MISIRAASANSVEFCGSDLGCTSRIYFDNLTLTLHNVTLTSQKPCQHDDKFVAKQTVINEVYVVFFLKKNTANSDNLLKIHKLHLLC